MAEVKLIHSDCTAAMKEMADCSVDSIVTDPPYELGFMGKSWDSSGIAYNVEMWREALRVLKPGGHLLAFSGSRTYHRMTCAIEDAGFEVRDQIMWVYGSGFPKSLNVSKALSKNVYVNARDLQGIDSESDKYKGWGTALKPAHEPICVARKPLIGTVAANVLAHGTGAINVDGCRVGESGASRKISAEVRGNIANTYGDGLNGGGGERNLPFGRWPANLIHDGSEEATERMGEPARFFYCAKANKRDRDDGLEGFEMRQPTHGKGHESGGLQVSNSKLPKANFHPTVKPTDLMRYLCRLVTPPKGIVLDPFMGSGSTGKAAVLEGFQFIGIDMTAEYVAIADARIKFASEQSVEEANQLELL